MLWKEEEWRLLNANRVLRMSILDEMWDASLKAYTGPWWMRPQVEVNVRGYRLKVNIEDTRYIEDIEI